MIYTAKNYFVRINDVENNNSENIVNEEKKTSRVKKAAPALVRFLQGALVGVGGILPGISGGVLCAIFGLYQPLMEVLAHPIRNLKKHFKLLLPVVIGIAFGFLALAKVVEIVFRSNQTVATCIFVGLILGMLPSLWKEAGEYGRKKSSYISAAVAFVILFALFLFLELGAQISISDPNGWWFAFCGICWGLGVVVPGMSASSPLLFLGLYEPLMNVITSFTDSAAAFVMGKISFGAALGNMNFAAVIPFGIGIVGSILGLARPVNYLLKKRPSQMYHAIFGIVLATTLPVLIFKIYLETDVAEGVPKTALIVKMGFIALGFVCAWLVDKLSRKYAS